MHGHETVTTETMVGWRADQYRGVLKLRHPMQNGIIEDWDAMLNVSIYSTLWAEGFMKMVNLEILSWNRFIDKG